MNLRNFLTILGLIIIAVGSWYLASQHRPAEVVKTVSDSAFDGYYLRNARIFGTSSTGQLLYEIEAEYAEQQSNDEIELQNVLISYSSGAEVPWTISADVAVISDGHNLLRLSGHVIAFSDTGFSGQATEIRAPVLDIDKDNRQD